MRFEVRFGLRLSRHAEQLSANAIQMGMLEKVSGPRLFGELQLILREARPWAILQRLEARAEVDHLLPGAARLVGEDEQQVARAGHGEHLVHRVHLVGNHRDLVGASYMLSTTVYGVTYSIIVLILAMLIFRKRDFV